MYFQSLLRHNYKLLSRCLVVSDELLFELKSVDCMRDKVPQIRMQTTAEQKIAELLNIIEDVPDSQQLSVFSALLSALRQDGQEHVANIFLPESDARPMSDEHYHLLISKTEELSHFINPNYSLLNKLVADGVFIKRDTSSVMSRTSYDDMSTELVNILLRKSDSSFDKFIEALNSTEQQHVVHILTGQGESPLSHLRRLVLRKARKKLVSKVDTVHTSLLAELISSGVLTDAESQRIEVSSANDARTATLIEVIARKSQLAYDKFIQALKDSGHGEVAVLLEGLELRGRIDPDFLSNTAQQPDRKRIIQFVRNDMQALVTGAGDAVQVMTGLMQQNGFAVSQINDGSIHISFRCFTEESLENLKRLYTDKTLDKLFTEAFCPPLADHGLESLTLRITGIEFQRLAESFEKSRKIFLEQFTVLPLELLELVLVRTFVRLFTDHYKTHEVIRLAYSTLAGVCNNWWQTMNGWPQSTTRHWLKHKLRRALTSVCRPYVVSPRLQSSVPVSASVCGVTVCDDKLFVACYDSNSILVFGPNNKQQTNIELKHLIAPTDIASCAETRQLFVADVLHDSYCVWRVSLDGRQIVKWLPKKSTTSTSQFSPVTLSVTSRRLLVTSHENRELLSCGTDGVELKRVPLPDTMTSLQHAVETSRGTFIVSHSEPQPRVCEVDDDGQVMRAYRDQQQLSIPVYLSLDSDGRIFVAEWDKGRVLLLNSETLELERVLLDEQQHQLTRYPCRLCYTQQTQQLAVGGCWPGVSRCVQFFTVH